MYGGYAEVYAFAKDADNQVSVNNGSHAGCHACEYVNKIFCGLKRSPSELEDFILISECEETCGPIPIAVIPHGSAKQVDINGLALQLLSADYQGLGSSSSIPFADSQALLLDIMPEVHSVVNYFTLLDIQARGYVRPMCVAYVSTDKCKLVKTFLSVRAKLVEACKVLKYHNWLLFLQELNQTLSNLSYTKLERNEHKDSEAPSSVLKVQDELIDSTSLDLVTMRDNLLPLIAREEEKQNATLKRFHKALNRHKNCMGFPSHPFSNKCDKLKPQRLVLPLRENFKNGLRSVSHVCGYGYSLGMYHFHITQKYFMRKYENIALNNENEIPEGQCLRFGACLRDPSVSMKYQQQKILCHCILPSIPDTSDIDKSHFEHLDEEYFNLLSQSDECYSMLNSCRALDLGEDLSSDSESTSGATTSESDSLPIAAVGSDDNKEIENACPLENKCNWHGATINKLLDVVDYWQGTSNESKALEALKKLGNLHYLVYSILMGYPALIMGTNEQQETVKSVVLILSCLVPRSDKDELWMEVWREIPSTQADIQGIAVSGMLLPKDNKIEKLIPKELMNQITIVNLKKNSITGPTYQGELLGWISKRIKAIPVKGPLLSVLVSMLSEIEIRVQIWNLIRNRTSQSAADKYFIQKGYSQNDLDILQTLSNMLS